MKENLCIYFRFFFDFVVVVVAAIFLSPSENCSLANSAAFIDDTLQKHTKTKYYNTKWAKQTKKREYESNVILS